MRPMFSFAQCQMPIACIEGSVVAAEMTSIMNGREAIGAMRGLACGSDHTKLGARLRRTRGITSH